MSLSILIPGLVAMLLGVAAGHVRWPLRPGPAVVMFSLVLVGAAAAAAMIVLAAGVGFILEQPAVAATIGWCPLIAGHHGTGWVLGLPAVVLLGLVAFRVRAVLLNRRAARRGTAGRRFLMLATDEPIAYAAPGRPGCIVVSSGMLDALNGREREVLFAHERAHLDRHHHRYLLAAELGVAVLPPLRPLANQLLLATEKSADECAALAVDGDRHLVASTIARAALARTAHGPAVASFSGGAVVQRVDALIGEPTSAPVLAIGALISSVSVVAAWSASSIQLHHLAVIARHVCGG